MSRFVASLVRLRKMTLKLLMCEVTIKFSTIVGLTSPNAVSSVVGTNPLSSDSVVSVTGGSGATSMKVMLTVADAVMMCC